MKKTLSTLICVLCLVSLSETSLAAEKCPGEGKIRSKPSRQAATMTFKNMTTGTVTIYWLDFKGRRKSYQTLAVGRSYDQETFISHPWIAVTAVGDCVGPYIPKRKPQQILIH